MDIQKKVIVVTGGGNGLGREIVLQLLAKGSKVVAVDVNKSALQETTELAGEYQHSLTTFCTDITDRAAIEMLKKQVLKKHDIINGIINNAGIIQPFKNLNVLDFDAIDRVMNVNFFGMLNMTKIFLPSLLSAPEAHIVNVSSLGGFLPVATQSIYGASKAAIKIFSEALALELSESYVAITTVIPGAMYTSIKANSGLGKEAGAGPEGHTANAALSPVKAASIIIDAIEHNKRQVYIGKDAKSMKVLYKFMPETAKKIIYNKMMR